MTGESVLAIGSRTPVPVFKRKSKGYWKSGSLLECSSVHDENADVRSYNFIDPQGGGFKFKPGQHISLLLSLKDGEAYRTFTIASSPSRPDSITLTVKKNRPDHGTDWMRRKIQPGTQLQAVGPVGHFNLIDNPCDKLLLISAGVGITPMVSMLRWLADREEAIDITFIHYASNPAEFLFSDELRDLDARMPKLRLHQISTQLPKGGKGDHLAGRLSRQQILALTALGDRQIFCCGPIGFMAKVKAIVQEEDVDLACYHQESFGAEGLEDETALQPALLTSVHEDEDVEAAMVNVQYKGRRFEVKKGALLLDALRQNKFVVATGCKSGMCGTCQLKIQSGRVTMAHQGGLSEEEEKKGYVLACCSTVQTDLTITQV